MVNMKSLHPQDLPQGLSWPCFTSVRPAAGTAACPCDGEVVVWTNSFGENSRLIRLHFNVQLLAYEGEQCVIPAFPLLQVALVVTIVETDFTPHTFALCSQTLLG